MFSPVPVKESSNIKAVEYEPDSKTLRIEFKSGGTYDYNGVEQDKVDAFAAAQSSGQHFHNYIKGYYEFKKIG